MKTQLVLSVALAFTLMVGTRVAFAEDTTISGSTIEAPVAIAGTALAISPAALLGSQQDAAEWQRRYDIARNRRDSGKRKIWLGLALDGGGVAIALLAANDCLNSGPFESCNGSSTAAMLGGLTAAAGGVTFLWGLIQYIDGNGEVHSLEATRPAGRTTTLIPLTDHQALQLGLGRRQLVAYSVRW